MVDNVQKAKDDISKVEVWMTAHPSATKAIAVISLLAIGFILGKLI